MSRIFSELDRILTGNAGEELPGKQLDVRAWERRKVVDFEEIEYALAVQIRDDADVISIIKTLPQVYAFVPVVPVVLSKCGEDS